MTPAPGERRQEFVGNRVRFTLRDREGRRPAPGWRARLRTNLGRAGALRREILEAHTRGLPLAGASWHDIPMLVEDQGWSIELPLAEVGYFKAKAYLVDPRGWQHWPEGPDVGLTVHPDCYRSANILYCAFTRMFGPTRSALSTQNEALDRLLAPLDHGGYAVIPPSGKLRDLVRQLPHILDTLGCRILHLLPVHPTPTTYARFGRFGSPYASLDLTAIDPALVEFDRRTTGIDQFRELTYEVHRRGGRVFLDIVINHTGWGSVLQENHPEWFLRQADGRFVSPGAWGVTWEDLVELEHRHVALWDELAEMFLTWCRRGVDGFRCDAGYKVPVAAWQYIVARVQQEYPQTLFLLEGLGGAWEATEALLTEGGLHWAYSELFQNYSGAQVAGYLDHSLKQSRRVGLLVHYSETHDNDRLAARGRAWSLLRNRLCALTSVSGGFGFTCGVEWLAAEKIRVHDSSAMAWDNPQNIVPELARLHRLLTDHPCFFDGAELERLSPPDARVYALRRDSADGLDRVLVLVNTDPDHAGSLALEPDRVVQSAKAKLDARGKPGARDESAELKEWIDLLGQTPPPLRTGPGGRLMFALPPGAAYCLAPTPQPRGLAGEDYRRARAQAAWGIAALSELLPAEKIGRFDWRELAAQVDHSPARFLAALSASASPEDPNADDPEARKPESAGSAALERLQAALAAPHAFYSQVVAWTLADVRRITVVPPAHWLLLHDSVPFRATLDVAGSDAGAPRNVESIAVREGHIACFPPRDSAAEATPLVERYADTDQHVRAAIHFLAPSPDAALPAVHSPGRTLRSDDMVLLTNGRGAMARLGVDLGRVRSKYDCVLGANLHPTLPVDRHILVKRIRVWVSADGFISPLDFTSLASLDPGPPAVWSFVANAGDGRTVQILMSAEMLHGRNTTVFRFSRPTAADARGKQLPGGADVRLTVRLDLEDRNFHWETRRNGGAEFHFSTHVRPLDSPRIGFAFTPAPDRMLRAYADSGAYHPQPEWSENLPHPVEQSRAQVGSGDAYSPGWFDLPLPKGANVTLVVTADPTDPLPDELAPAGGAATARGSGAQPPGDAGSETGVPQEASPRSLAAAGGPGPGPEDDLFDAQLARAIRAFVVQRDNGKTVIAGYPWFLDWGRDTFICARGLLAAGMTEEVKQVLLTFARFEKDGTLPNTIFGQDASNRDTSDAPLWFGVVCEELAERGGPLEQISPVLPAVLESIALHYAQGTPNGIRMDPASALIWSPSHFTWMDTNYPAGSPRQGYPVEIQALWIRLLRHLARLDARQRQRWQSLADQALASVEQFFWREQPGYYADVLLAGPGQPAAEATADDALRSNCLFLAALGLVHRERARRCVEAARRYLVVPGALRSLAPLPVSVPLPIYSHDGRLLNDPRAPYWGRYEGDEDTRRKPAYHNGTAWTWTFPVFCEALARAWDFAPPARAAARAYLGSMAGLLRTGCLGQLPEILDGDAPHTQRGCDAQAWGATEALRVWRLLRDR